MTIRAYPRRRPLHYPLTLEQVRRVPRNIPMLGSAATTNGSAATAAQTLTMPADVVDGNLLLAAVRVPLAATTISFPSGWNTIDNAVSGLNNQAVAWRRADGSEGASQAITLGADDRMAGVCLRIVGAETRGVILGFVTASNDNTPNPVPGYTGRGALPSMFVVFAGQETARTLSTLPDGYEGLSYQANGGATGNGQVTIAAMYKQAVAYKDDPAVWTTGWDSSLADWRSVTIPILPYGYPIGRLS